MSATRDEDLYCNEEMPLEEDGETASCEDEPAFEDVVVGLLSEILERIAGLESAMPKRRAPAEKKLRRPAKDAAAALPPKPPGSAAAWARQQIAGKKANPLFAPTVVAELRAWTSNEETPALRWGDVDEETRGRVKEMYDAAVEQYATAVAALEAPEADA